MKYFGMIFILIALVSLFCGCENLAKNTRQTAKNFKALCCDGYSKDLYQSR